MAGIQISVQQNGFPVSFFKGFDIVVLKVFEIYQILLTPC